MRFAFLLLVMLSLGFDADCRAQMERTPLPEPVNRAVDFSREVLPLLKVHCWKCHSASRQEGGLRLDRQRLALEGGDSGPDILPKKSAESRLIQLVSGQDRDRLMPPEGVRLSSQEIAVLRAWIDQGAVWIEDKEELAGDEHWSYQPIDRPLVPDVTASGPVRNPVDSFVRHRLAQQKLKPSAETDRRTLIRRVFLDLIGIPPTPEEVESFLRDDSNLAFERVVDRLLMSSHFGERWGRHWLDLARYADSDGYEKDNTRPDAWRWRDWVIDAVNRDLPFDAFTIEQLAGDLLPDASPAQKLATAFHRQTLTNTEGGADQEQFRVEACFDRVETTGAVWLGLTVGCARCHSHKYDRISQREYYKLFAFANNGDESMTAVPVSEESLAKYKAAFADWNRKHQELEAAFESGKKQLQNALSEWESQWRMKVAAFDSAKEAQQSGVKYIPVTFEDMKSASGAALERLDDGSIRASGSLKPVDEYTLLMQVPPGEFSGFQLEMIPDDSLPGMGAGRAKNGNFVLSDVRVYLGGSQKLQVADRISLQSARADFHQAEFPAENAIDPETAKTGWAVAPQMKSPHQWEVLFTKPINAGEKKWMQIVLDQQYGQQHLLGRFRVNLRQGSNPRDGMPETVLAALVKSSEERTADQKKAVLDWFARQQHATRESAAQLDAHQKAKPAEPVMNVRVISQRAANPRATFVLRRGDFLDPLKDRPIEAGGLSILPKLTPRNPETQDRLDLARWLVSKDNPLTPRVTVNQIWLHLFGEGLVRTPSDFGVRGEKPTHPELLDWLAREFMEPGVKLSFADDENNAHRTNQRFHLSREDQLKLKEQLSSAWSRKRLIRLIVTSATYRQSSAHRPELAEIDPANLLLARQNRLRVEAEIIRDLCLSVSGLLSEKIGGPSVFPPLPPGVAELSYAGNFKWTPSSGEDRYRRGMYTFFKRTAPHPNLTSFDCPDANLTCIKRQSSNTPLQALILLNNDTFLDAARAFGRRIEQLPLPTDAERLNRAFELSLSRPMTGTEATQFAELLAASRDWYQRHPDDAKQIAGSQPPDSTAWIATCRVLLNLDEFVTRN